MLAVPTVRPLRYPPAAWQPSPNFGYGGPWLEPKAYVQHSADSSPMGEPPSRFFTRVPNRGSVHFWIYANGKMLQFVELNQAAYGNGTLDRHDGLNSPYAIVREWYRTRRNPNLETWSCEFTGMGASKGYPWPENQPTDDQMYEFVKLAEWSKAEGWLDFTKPEALLLHSDISATACPDQRFDVAYLLAAIEGNDDMAKDPRVDKIMKAIFGDEAELDRLLKIEAPRLAERVDRMERDGGWLDARLDLMDEELAELEDALEGVTAGGGAFDVRGSLTLTPREETE